jgi:hypothetical protein
MKVTERIRAVCSCFCNGHRANFAAICRASGFAKSKERTHAPAPFLVLPARFAGKQCAQSKLVISHCLSDHKDLQMLLHNIREPKSTFFIQTQINNIVAT